MQKKIRMIFIWILCIGLIVAFIVYVYENADQYIEIFNVSPLPVILIMTATLISLIVSGIINVFLYESLGAKLPFRNSLFLTASSTLANQLPISGGIVTKGFYLKRKYRLSYAKFFSSSLALLFCFISVNGLVGLVILLYKIIFIGIPISHFLLIGFVVMTSSLVVFWLPFERIKVPHKIREWLDGALSGWVLISRNPILVGKLVGLQIFLMFILAIRYWFAFRMLSQDVKISDVILFSSISVLTQMVSFAPGGLGITETIVGGVAFLLGFELGVSIVAVGLDRLISTSVILVVGGISTVILGKQLSVDLPKPDEL